MHQTFYFSLSTQNFFLFYVQKSFINKFQNLTRNQNENIVGDGQGV